MAKARRPKTDVQTLPDASPDVVSGEITAAEIYTTDPDRIAARAYEIYLERGAADGRDFDDWLTAERELTPSTESRSGTDE